VSVKDLPKKEPMNNPLVNLLPVQDIRFDGDVDQKDLREVGASTPRRDAISHVTGRTVFFEDHTFPGMLHLKMVRSPHHHARILGIDFSEAERTPGFVRAITYRDVPYNYYTILRLIGVEPNDEPVLADDRVVYWGEPIAAVLAESPQAAAIAASRVKVNFELLEAVFDMEAALKPGAPIVTRQGFNYFRYEGHHCRRVRFGDVEQGFANADLIIERRWDTSPIEHAPMETTGCIAKPEGDGRFTVFTNTQALYFSLDNTALILGISPGRLHFVGGTVGGGFGGKVDVIVEPIATLGAILTNRPVKFVYTREEEMRVSSTRAAERFYIKDGVLRDGRVIARQITLYVDSGAYSRHSPYGTTKAAAHMPGPYTIPNVRVDAHCVYTNRQPSSAMRGFGVTLGDFAIESQMDVIAHELGIDPLRLRLINAYRDGDMKAHRKRVEGAALVEVIQKAAELAGQRLDPDLASMSSVRH
jgi:CO/xanthine dehydrogenase Mo-binding subunit